MNEYDPKPRSINSVMYADMIREKAGPAVRQVYPDGSAVFQDDGATIHRAAISLDAVAETFKSRVDYDLRLQRWQMYGRSKMFGLYSRTKLHKKSAQTNSSYGKRLFKLGWRLTKTRRSVRG